MKKKLTTILLLASAMLPGYAQSVEDFEVVDPMFTISPDEEDNSYPTKQFSVATNGFWSNWFVQAGLDFTAFYSDQEYGLNLSKSPFRAFRATPNISVALGKHISPNIAIRLKAQGLWGRTVVSSDRFTNKSNNFNLQLQPVVNLTSLFGGYKEDRVWDMSVFLGGGFNSNERAKTLTLSASFGLNSSWRLNRKFALFTELGTIINERESDGVLSQKSHETFRKDHDIAVYAELGLTYNIGKSGWKRSADMDAILMLHQAEIDALNARISDLKKENESLRK